MVWGILIILVLVPVLGYGPFPKSLIGPKLSGRESMVALGYWLGIPVSCDCEMFLWDCNYNGFSDNILGCGNGPLRICRHDTKRQQ